MVVGVMGDLFVVVAPAADAVVSLFSRDIFVSVAVDNGLPSQSTGQRALLLCHAFKLTSLAAKDRTQTPKQTRTRVERKEYNRRQRDKEG